MLFVSESGVCRSVLALSAMQRLLTQHGLTDCVECDAKVWGGGVEGVGDALDDMTLPVDSAALPPSPPPCRPAAPDLPRSLSHTFHSSPRPPHHLASCPTPSPPPCRPAAAVQRARDPGAPRSLSHTFHSSPRPPHHLASCPTPSPPPCRPVAAVQRARGPGVSRSLSHTFHTPRHSPSRRPCLCPTHSILCRPAAATQRARGQRRPH